MLYEVITHVTIARFGKNNHALVAEWLSNNELLRSQSELVSQFVLFSSHRTREGGYYAVEARFGHDFDHEDDEIEALPDGIGEP